MSQPSRVESCPLARSFGADASWQASKVHQAGEVRRELRAEPLERSVLVGQSVILRRLPGGSRSPDVRRRVKYSHCLPSGLVVSNLAALSSVFHRVARAIFVKPAVSPSTEKKTPILDLVRMTSLTSPPTPFPVLSLHIKLTGLPRLQGPSSRTLHILVPLPDMLFLQIPSDLLPHLTQVFG